MPDLRFDGNGQKEKHKQTEISYNFQFSANGIGAWVRENNRAYICKLTLSRHYKRHQNKVKVKGLGGNSSYLAGFSIFFFHGSLKKFNQLANKKNNWKFFSLPEKLK